MRADREPDPALRRLWLVAAIDAIIPRPIFLVGGAAVDLHTGRYQPTDVDLVGVVTTEDRSELVDAGFVESGGRHLRWDYPDGTSELVEFPGSKLDGTSERIQLSDTVTVNVISVESLVVDRITQATDGSIVTFDEAVRRSSAPDCRDGRSGRLGGCRRRDRCQPADLIPWIDGQGS